MENEFRCPWKDRQDIRRIADGVRSTYWPDRGLPVDAEYIIEFGVRLDIEPLKGLFSEFTIDAWLKLDFTGIIVDENFYLNEKFNNRLRFSFAHELGHFFVHRHLLEGLTFNSLQEWIEFILNIPEKDYGWFEWQANEFAGRLIVPLTELKVYVSTACEILRQDSTLLKHLTEEPDLILSGILPFLCKPFGVSEKVIETRMHNEGLWPPKAYFPDLF